MTAANIEGKHCHYEIPREGADPVRGAGVAVHFQPADQPLPRTLTLKYYHLAEDAVPELVNNKAVAAQDRIFILDQFGQHRAIGRASWGFLTLG